MIFPPEMLILCFMAILLNIMLFVPAYIFKTDKLTDLTYGLTFMVLAFAALFLKTASWPKFILFIMILLWAARLSTYLVIRIRKITRDSRFDGVRERFWKFLSFWLLQALSAWIILLPTLFFMFKPAEWTVFMAAGILIWATGIIIETVADQQKYSFKNNPSNKGKWIDTGLWHHSRHPNYFGEVLCWVGVYIYTLGNLTALESAIAAISPIYISFLLLKVTGIPKLEEEADKRWGESKAYQSYKKRTNAFLVMPRKK